MTGLRRDKQHTEMQYNNEVLRLYPVRHVESRSMVVPISRSYSAAPDSLKNNQSNQTEPRSTDLSDTGKRFGLTIIFGEYEPALAGVCRCCPTVAED